jgi:hypothetical protein
MVLGWCESGGKGVDVLELAAQSGDKMVAAYAALLGWLVKTAVVSSVKTGIACCAWFYYIVIARD